MAGGKPKAEILVDLDASPALNSLQKFGESMSATADEIASSLYPLRAAWDGITRVAGGALQVIEKWANAASEAQVIENKLAAAFKLRGDFTGKLTLLTQAYNEKLERSLGIDAENLANLQKTLLAMGVRTAKIEEATKASIGLSNVTGDLNSAARLIARAYEGNVEIFKRYGIVAKDTNEAIAKSVELFKLTEANANTYAGRLEKLDRAGERFNETMGNVVINNKGVNQTIENTTTILDKATPAIGRFFKSYLDAFTDPASGGPLGAALNVDNFTKAVEAMLTPVKDAELPTKALADQLERIADFDPTAWIGVPFLQPGQQGSQAKPQVVQGKTPGPAKFDDTGVLPGLFGGVGGALSSVGSSFAFSDIDQGGLRGGQEGALPALSIVDAAKDAAKKAEKDLSDITDRWLDDQRQAAIDGAQTSKDYLEIRKAIIEDETLTEEKRADFLRDLGEKELAFAATAAEKKMQIAETAAAYVAQTLTDMIQQAVKGEASLGKIFAKVFGGLLTAVGSALISLGTSAIAGGVVGSVAPWLAGVTGAQGAIAAGAAATVVGGVLVASGAALSNAGSSRKSGAAGIPSLSAGAGSPIASSAAGFAASAQRAVTSAAGRQSTSSVFDTGARRDDRPIVYNIQFGSGPAIVGGDPARVARDVNRFLERWGRLTQ